MKLVTYLGDRGPQVGVLMDDRVVDVGALSTSYAGDAPSASSVIELVTRQDKDLSILQDCISQWTSDPDRIDGDPLEEVRLLPPIPRAPKIVAVGRNYQDHADEASIELPRMPKLFPKFPSTVIGHEDHIELPSMSDSVDFEVEFAVVIGRHARDVSEEDAMRHVFGYTIINDVSARDIQFQDDQLAMAKNFQTFTPMGPCIVTSDELTDPSELDIRLRLNGETYQDSNTRNLIFDVPFLVSFISRVMDLEPGDIISTGTPSGVGTFREPPVYLKPGDVVESEVMGIGTLRNPVSERKD